MDARIWGSKRLGGTEKQIRERFKHAKDYQIGAFDEKGNCIGIIHGLRSDKISHTWDKMTSSGTFRNHKPSGKYIVCVSVGPDPAFLGGKVGAKLVGKAVVEGFRLGLKAFAYSRPIMGRHAGNPRLYVKKLLKKEVVDPSISKMHLAENAFKPAGQIYAVFRHGRKDKRAGNYNIVIFYPPEVIEQWLLSTNYPNAVEIIKEARENYKKVQGKGYWE